MLFGFHVFRFFLAAELGEGMNTVITGIADKLIQVQLSDQPEKIT